MLEGSFVRVILNAGGADRPGTAFIGRVGSIDYGGIQVTGRWHRKALKEDGQKEVPVGPADIQTFFPWTALDYIEIQPESDGREGQFAEHYRLGMNALKSKDYQSAGAHFREALTLKPEDQKSRYYLDEADRLAQGGAGA